MPTPATEAAPGSVTDVVCDALIVGATSSGDGIALRPAAADVDLQLEGLLATGGEEGFKAGVGDTFAVPSGGRMGARWVHLVGLGPEDELGPGVIRRASAAAVRGSTNRSAIALSLAEDPEGLEASVEGALLGSYRFEGYRSEPAPADPSRLLFVGAAPETVERARARAGATILARDLVNEPASVLTPMEFATRAGQVSAASGLTCEVIEEDQLRERGFGGILAVSKGSSEPPCLIVLRYEPEGASGDVALVGKGITFDSGGYSIKPAASMETMKTDMGGAAAVLGTMSALAELDVRVKVTGYLACSENMVSGAAMRPGDVVRHYGGRTTEVINTDAEGRLVLVDALELAAENGHDPIVDVATLTGSIHVALGGRVTGLFSNDDELSDAIQDAGARAGEQMWRMPIVDAYRSSIESDVADLKNQGVRWGGASIAALFLRGSVGSASWAHLDIAGTGRASSDREEIGKGGTGVAAMTLLRWLEARSGSR